MVVEGAGVMVVEGALVGGREVGAMSESAADVS